MASSLEADLKDRKSHFEFGKNWEAYSQLITSERIEIAKRSVIRLLGTDDLTGKTFLDIGCGSGLFSLAALMLGASRVVAIDIDENSVKTTGAVLAKFAKNKNYQVFEKSVFDLSKAEIGDFDIVYSWGVLHHTGAMYEAVEKASQFVKSDGIFAVALYEKTLLCKAWKVLKKIYVKSPRLFQHLYAGCFTASFALACLLTGRNPIKYIKDYKKNRGMSYMHDVHDWMGGFPYESISPSEMAQLGNKLGFRVEHEFIQGNTLGLFGSGCNEYLLIKA